MRVVTGGLCERIPRAKQGASRTDALQVLNEVLTNERDYVGPLTGDCKPTIQKLLSIFHKIGTASLVLRFVHPDQFGIFSNARYPSAPGHPAGNSRSLSRLL